MFVILSGRSLVYRIKKQKKYEGTFQWKLGPRLHSIKFISLFILNETGLGW
jgi:hypothetical protein